MGQIQNVAKELWSNGDYTNKVFINESGLYSLILSSKLPSAKKFKRWVTSEVLPSIKKHGGYIANQEQLSETEILARAVLLANNLIEEKNKQIESQQNEIRELKPDAEMMKQFRKTDKNIDIGDFAKILCTKDFKIGRNTLLKQLRDEG